METKIYNLETKKESSIKLPEKIFGLKWNPDLVHQVMLAMQANLRKNTAHVKTRADVRGGGKKPWRQKGTGRARHGSSRSPIWRGGGVTFGPTKERNYSQKINKKMKKRALLVALSQKARDNEILVLEDLKLKAPKTKEAANVIKSLSGIKGFERLAAKRKHTSLFLLPEKNETLARSFKNIPNTDTIEARNLNLLDVLNYKYLVLPKETLKNLEST